eukprot:Skav205029  [mRNA]  locus=scaffold2669:21585:26642:+ [translate_table: standard]
MGSSNDRMWVLVSWRVHLVVWIWPHVSRSSDSNRRRICWFSFTRSFMAWSDFCVASVVCRAMRWISSCASLRSSLAASSRWIADWFSRNASFCLSTSLRKDSCAATSWRAAWAPAVRLRAVEGGRLEVLGRIKPRR